MFLPESKYLSIKENLRFRTYFLTPCSDTIYTHKQIHIILTPDPSRAVL